MIASVVVFTGHWSDHHTLRIDGINVLNFDGFGSAHVVKVLVFMDRFGLCYVISLTKFAPERVQHQLDNTFPCGIVFHHVWNQVNVFLWYDLLDKVSFLLLGITCAGASILTLRNLSIWSANNPFFFSYQWQTSYISITILLRLKHVAAREWPKLFHAAFRVTVFTEVMIFLVGAYFGRSKNRLLVDSGW